MHQGDKLIKVINEQFAENSKKLRPEKGEFQKAFNWIQTKEPFQPIDSETR
jgi:hypothetical protein